MTVSYYSISSLIVATCFTDPPSVFPKAVLRGYIFNTETPVAVTFVASYLWANCPKKKE
jgi:hypothetical protein